MLREQLQALALCGLSLTNYALFYLTSILLARTLSIRDFDDYNVAVSTVLILAAIATLGLEKYALRCLPTLSHAKDWSQSQGFLLFSQRLIVASSVVLVVLLGVALEGTLALRGKDYHVAIVIVVLFLPVVARFQFLLEVVTSYGGQVKAVAIYRLLFPMALLILNAVVWISPAASNAVSAAVCYGAAWIIALAALHVLFKRQVPTSVWQAKPTRQARRWLLGAWPLAASSLILTMFAQTGIIILELNHPNESVVSAYALAFQTGTFVVILATATNRLYSPKISQLLASGDFPGLRATAQRRLLLIGPLSIIFLLLIFIFGRSILAIFGPEFVSAYPALCIIAVGASISTLFSLAPTYLQFTDRSRSVLSAMVASVMLSLILCFPLSYYFGATGAAIAYAIPISMLYAALRVVAWRDVTRYV
ncbi:MAG: oligosaccharide flippase family protein [Pirellulaceae bacterium]|jgi:O-antigen/teichoic acid export membrane protein|nr:oligosaccharide flippase family protein [Pirellulaceae bacterium]